MMVWEGNHGWRKVYLVKHQRSQAYPVMVSLMGRSVGSCLILFLCLVIGVRLLWANSVSSENWKWNRREQGHAPSCRAPLHTSVTVSDCSTFQRVMAIASLCLVNLTQVSFNSQTQDRIWG